VVNRKKVQRLWREEGLRVRIGRHTTPTTCPTGRANIAGGLGFPLSRMPRRARAAATGGAPRWTTIHPRTSGGTPGRRSNP